MVSTSLFTGLSGLRSHQRYIDVIGNNLANVSTPGFWSSRATFSDILSFTMRSGSGPSNQFGGLNPMQIGLGTQLSSVDMNTEQGTFQNTGRTLDVAIQGRGFFTLSDGQRSYYTRVGTFGLDSQRSLVDMRSGYRVVNSSGANVTVPLTDTLPPKATSVITFAGNLPAEVGGPLEEILETSKPLLAGTAAQRLATAPIGTTFNLGTFLGKDILVSINGGASHKVTFPTTMNNPATPSEIVAEFNKATPPFNNILTFVPNDGAGTISFATVKLGTAATLKFDDGPGAGGLLQTLGLDAALTKGSETAPTGTTDLNDLTVRNKPYITGDQIAVTGTNPDGTVASNTFRYGIDGTTLDQFVAFLNQTYDSTQATATLETSGAIRLTATNKGPAQMSLSLADAKGNTGTSAFPSIKTIQDGQGPDTASTPHDVIDTLGRSHSITMTFTRTTNDPSVWDLKATMDATNGTISADTISSIRFNSDGSFNVIGGGSSTFTFQFAGLTAAQNVTVDLGETGTFKGLSMVGDSTTVAATGQDGYTTGNLQNISFDASGALQGFYSNGQDRLIDMLRITLFPNEAGLMRSGDTLFIESPSSDDAIATTAGTAGAGIVRPGALENSNVDIAEEFVKLITAQRGFQANSRMITTADEILAELVNIKR